MTDMPPYLAAKDEDNSVQVDSDSSDFEDDLPLCYDKPRHLEPIQGEEREEHTWRVKEKRQQCVLILPATLLIKTTMAYTVNPIFSFNFQASLASDGLKRWMYKTHCVALVLCLNVGVDPPDVVKTQPCARLECWIDPNSMSPSKALESIGHALQSQYERWQPRARYKQSLDPTSEEIKKLCCSLRRNAKEERVLFHYNGHGVPKPTAQGEIWVFNRAYTQYIPLSMYDLQTWMGAPSLYVYDCSNAGVIVDNFKQFAEQHERDYEKLSRSGEGAPEPHVSYRNCIQLGACAAGQALPMSPDLPADLFTACLTTPVKMAVRWFVLRTRLRVARADLVDLIDKIPGQVTDRRTMLGELNWIFTAITDTIAWSSLPTDLFQQLFRADLLTASLCRNYLLADRIMRSYNCTPVSAPALPSLARHALWGAWEHTLDLALAQLPALAAGAPYIHAPFFRDQLTAFRLWLGPGAGARPPPQQLPMVLQVLLSTLHRVRALQILCRFLALGPGAVRAVLAVGIFPYMLKLLQASAHDLRASMVYIWAKIIAVDPSCQVDLVNAKGHKYFVAVLQDPTVDSEHRTLAAFVLAGIVDNYPAGQEAALQGSLISACLEQLGEGGRCGCGALAQWACVALGRLWRAHDAARWAGVRDLAHEKLFALLAHPRAEVRAACAFALGTFAPAARTRTDHANALDHQVAVRLAARLPLDTSPLVRAEILAALQWIVLIFEQHFIAVYLQERLRRGDKESVRGRARVDPGQDALATGSRAIPFARPAPLVLPSIGFGSVYAKLWSTLSDMAREPHPELARMAKDIIEYVANQAESVDPERSGFMSQPSSPNTRASVGDARTHTLPGPRRGKSSLPHTISEDSVRARDRDSTSSSSSQLLKKPIVSTQFVEWATAQFARGDAAGCSCAPPPAPAPPHAPVDCESAAYHERLWRRARNASIRKEARALRAGRAPRLETQAFHSRCPLPPAVVLFHPYEQHAAVASKDNFGVWDWGTAAKLLVGRWERAWGRITALAYLNAHARALLAVASHSGNVAIYRPGSSGAEPALVGAWRGLDVRPAPDYRPPPAQPIYSLAQLMSEQWSAADERQTSNKSKSTDTKGGGSAMSGYSPPPPATLLRWAARSGTLGVAGAAPALRLWDVRHEMLLADVPTRSDAPVTALWRGGDQAVAGFGDGYVRAWDLRAGTEPTFTLEPLGERVLCTAPRHDRHALIAGAVDGEVRIYDTRKLTPVHVLRAPAPLAALDVHPRADLLACGSVNQCISTYDLKGAHLSTIKFHEGFMGARIGPVSCLTFHPLRCAMGVGSKDSTVSVYVSEARR